MPNEVDSFARREFEVSKKRRELLGAISSNPGGVLTRPPEGKRIRISEESLAPFKNCPTRLKGLITTCISPMHHDRQQPIRVHVLHRVPQGVRVAVPGLGIAGRAADLVG